MRYAITSVDNIYPLNTKTEVLDMINRFSSIKEYFKEEVAKNLYEVANEMNIMIPNNSEIYRFISLKNESVDKSNVFECEYYYVSSSELEEDNTFDDISKMSKSINKAIDRSDIFKSNTSLNPNSDDGKSFTTNLYSCIKIDDNTFGFIKIALLNVIYYNRYTFNYEIIKVIDFDINSIYKAQTSNNLDEEIDIERDIDFYYLGESTELQKKTLKDSDYGIPELKKFPMHDKKHVLLAIKFFNTYVGTKYEKELADNINKKIIEFEIDDSEIHMTKVNQFAKYYKLYNKKTLEESYEDYSSLNETQNIIVNMYHLSQSNLDNIEIKPSIPDNFLTKNGYEDNKTPRVCFSKSIDGCLRGLSQNLNDKEFYVHAPIYQRNIKQHIVHPTVDKVPDCKITKEVWITVPVKMKCIGKIKVLKDRGDDGLPYTYGKGKDKHTAELYDWDWIWIEKYNETSLLKEEYLIPSNKIPKKLYHLSLENHNDKIFKPKEMIGTSTNNGLESSTARICFSDDIGRALLSILPQGNYDLQLYVHVPVLNGQKIYGTTKKDVYDSEITHEIWIKEPVKIKCIGKIEVYGIDKKYETLDLSQYKNHIPNKAKYNFFKWKWVERYNGTSLDENYNILNENNTVLENIFSNLTKKVKIDRDSKEFIISGFNFNKFLLRVKEIYNHRGLENLFDKKYSLWSEMMFKREAINRKDMKIVNLRVPLFFALEMYKLFLDLSKAYKLPYYEGVSKAIFNKTWINKYLQYEKKYTNLSNLKNIKFTLKDHQRKFVSDYTCYKNIYDLEGYILTFKPGLGKTLTAISLAECLNKKQVIIVCPNTIKENWYYEIKSYFSKYENDKIAKDEIFILGNSKYSYTNNTKYLIVNMESIDKVFKYVSKTKDTMIIVDESHNFKDYKNKRCKDLLKLKELCNCTDNLMMSGTPIKATPDEIIPSLRMIDPYFTEELAYKYEKSFKSNSTEIANIVRERFNRTMYSSPKDAIKLPDKHIEDLYLTIKNPEPYYISVLNKEIIRLFNINYNNELADLNDLKLDFESLIMRYSTASKIETKRYLDFINRVVDPNKSVDTNISDFRKELYDTFLQQYVYNNPNLTNIDRKNIELLVSKYIHIRNVAMGKAIGEVLPKARSNCYIDIFNENYKKIIDMINNNTKKTIIFTSFVPVANHVCELLNKNGVKALKIIGATKNNDRIDIINRFKVEDDIDVLVATTQTLSIGVTITEASQMFFLGTPYRDADFKQACDRIYRIGQTSDVYIYKVLLRNSGNNKNITDRINDILEWSKEMTDSLLMEDINKTELADKVVGLFKDNGFNPKVSKKSLKDFIAGKESDIGGKSLCIAGLGNEYSKLSKTCSLINKEIKPLGAKISPDNYGTAFLKVLKEDTNQNNKWYYVASKKADLKKGSVDEDLTYNNILDALKGSSLVHDLKMYHNEEFYNKEHTGYLYDFNSDESKEGPYTPYYKGEIKFTVTQEDDGSDFYDWELIRINNESVEVQEIKPDNCPKCNSNNLQTYFKGGYFRIRCNDCKNELGKFSAEAVKNESSTAGVAVAPSVQGKSPYVNIYPTRNDNIPEGIKDVKNVLDDFYSVKEKPNMLSESLLPNKIFNEHPIFADVKTLFGYDRVRLNKDIFERYTEEFKKLGFNQEGKVFNPESDCGEIIVDKNKNIKACILINRNYVVKKLPYNILYFIHVDDSICDEKHTKEIWLQNLSNIAFNRYSCEFIEVDKSNKELIQYYIEDHYGFSVLDDNGKKLVLTARTDLIESFNIVLNNSESLLNEEIESESKFNMEEYSLDKLGTSSGVYSKLGLWNPIVKIKGQNYRERCEAIIFNDNNEIFMGINVNRTRIPGGGTMPNIPIEEQLKEECREEVRINIKDINYIGCYKNVYTDAHKEIFDRRSDIENVEYEGALTYLFTAKYDSKYTGDINALDRDDLINEGRFYPISKVLSSNIKNEWKVAIINYLAKNSMNDSYISLWNRMTLDTNFLELVKNNDKSTIKTEAYNILTEEENSSKLKAKRNKIEKLIYTTFNLLDSTGKNSEKYKEHYKSLSDKDFFKEIQSMLDDNKKNFYLEILPNVNEPSLKAVKETADYLDLELDNYIYYRNDEDSNEPVRSSYKVPVGGLTIKRLRVKRFLRIIPQKKLYLYNFN